MMEKNHSLTVSSVKRIHGKAILTLSNGETLFMPRAMLRERPYRSGMPFDKTSFELLMADRSYPFAMDKAVAMLSLRSRTEKEIAESLRKNAYPEMTIARVMARLVEAGYLNDAAFAENWVVSRTNKGMGSRRIRMELRNKGVSQDEIDSALSSVDEDEILSSAVKIAEKAARGKDLTSIANRQKIMAALARRGYEYTVARHALQTIIK